MLRSIEIGQSRDELSQTASASVSPTTQLNPRTGIERFNRRIPFVLRVGTRGSTTVLACMNSAAADRER